MVFVGMRIEAFCLKVSKGAKIRNRYNQVPHLTQDTNGKVTNAQLDTTKESQEVSPFPAGDHKAHINRRTQRHSKHKTEQKHKISTKEVPPWNEVIILHWRKTVLFSLHRHTKELLLLTTLKRSSSFGTVYN